MLHNGSSKGVKISSASKMYLRTLGQRSRNLELYQDCRTEESLSLTQRFDLREIVSIVLGGQSVCREPTGTQEGGEGQPRQDYRAGICTGLTVLGSAWGKKVACVSGAVSPQNCNFSCPALVTNLEEEVFQVTEGLEKKSPNARYWVQFGAQTGPVFPGPCPLLFPGVLPSMCCQ